MWNSIDLKSSKYTAAFLRSCAFGAVIMCFWGCLMSFFLDDGKFRGGGSCSSEHPRGLGQAKHHEACNSSSPSEVHHRWCCKAASRCFFTSMAAQLSKFYSSTGRLEGRLSDKLCVPHADCVDDGSETACPGMLGPCMQ